MPIYTGWSVNGCAARAVGFFNQDAASRQDREGGGDRRRGERRGSVGERAIHITYCHSALS